MARPKFQNWRTEASWEELREEVKRAFNEFLTVPLIVVAGFLLLAVAMYLLDHAELPYLQPVRQTLQKHVFGESQATRDLLGTVAGGLITITSITFSLLLLAVQQSAATMTSRVFDQFLRRQINRLAFGFFIGLALYALLILTTAHSTFNPVFGALVALLLSGVALMLLPLLLYTTIDQMRPETIIEAIHDLVLGARQHQLLLLERTRRVADQTLPRRRLVRSPHRGYITGIDVEAIDRAVVRTGQRVEVVLRVCIGSYVAYEDVLAEIHAGDDTGLRIVEEAVDRSIQLERQRILDLDPAYGIHEMVNIAWTSISTAKQNPAPGLMVTRSLRDILVRWSHDEAAKSEGNGSPSEHRLTGAAPQTATPSQNGRQSPEGGRPDQREATVVYYDDVLTHLMDAFESLAVASSESLQHQVCAEIIRAFAVVFNRLTPELSDRAEVAIRRLLPALGDHVLTTELDAALCSLVDALEETARFDVAQQVAAARATLAESIGQLASRSTRVQT